MIRLALWPVVFLFLFPAYTYAQDATRLTVNDASVLKDVVAPLGVLVQVTPSENEGLGLHEDDVRRDVELKLRIAGITIDLDEDDFAHNVFVSVHVVCAQGGTACCYDIEVSYREPVLVIRGDEHIVVHGAQTWVTSGVGGVSRNALRSIRDDVKDKLDVFINAYLTANPKQ